MRCSAYHSDRCWQRLLCGHEKEKRKKIRVRKVKSTLTTTLATGFINRTTCLTTCLITRGRLGRAPANRCRIGSNINPNSPRRSTPRVNRAANRCHLAARSPLTMGASPIDPPSQRWRATRRDPARACRFWKQPISKQPCRFLSTPLGTVADAYGFTRWKCDKILRKFWK